MCQQPPWRTMAVAVLFGVWLLTVPAVVVAADARVSEPISTLRFPGEEWEVASPESQKVDLAKLKAAVAYMDENFGPGAQSN